MLRAQTGPGQTKGEATAAEPETAVLEYTGAPLAVALFPCKDEDLQFAGLACTEGDCPIYLELTHAAGQGSTILAAGDFHAAAATMQSVLLRSADGGRTLAGAVSPHPRRGSWDGIQVYDERTAWVSGQLMQPLALDPFLLRTTDGGKTWERTPLFEEEGTPGGIVHFHFDSREEGRVVTEHGGGSSEEYALYETHSAGREWSLIGRSAEMPKLKTEENDWRVQPEPKLFRLQHREEGTWKPFASFALRAASCRETPAPDKAEPAPEK